MKKLKRLSERCLALFTALVMCVGLVQAAAFAGDLGADSGEPPEYACGKENHTHSDACCNLVCGLEEAEASEGSSCTHEHDSSCGYAEAEDEISCTCSGTNEDGEIVHTEDCTYQPAAAGSPCTHEHDSSCGYAEAAEGHTHTDECKELTCPQEEHIHSEACLAQEEPSAGNQPECICATRCGGEFVNAECPVCGAEYADLTACKGEEVPAEVPAGVQKFLDAVAALPPVEEIPEEATKAEYEELRALVEACQDAYDALPEEYMAREDVTAAIVTLGTATEKFAAIQPLGEVERPLDRWNMMSEEERTALLDSFTESGLYRSTDWSVVVFKGGPDAPFVWPGLFDKWTSSGYGDHRAEIRSVVKELIVVGNVDFSKSAHKITHGECWYKLEKITLNDVNLPDESTVFTNAGGNCITLTVNGGSIGARAFSNSGIETAVLNNSVIGEYAFESSMGLTEVTVNGGSIGASAFANCSYLSNVTLDGIKSSNPMTGFIPSSSITDLTLCNMAETGFGGTDLCNSLEHLTVKDVNKITESAFAGDYYLQSVALEGVEIIGDEAFSGCSILGPIDLSHVSKIGNGAFKSAFAYAADIDLTINATEIGSGVFRNSNVKNVTFNQPVNIKADLFNLCKQLQSVTLNAGGTIGTSAFQDCTNLTTVNGLKDATYIGGRAFERCEKLDLSNRTSGTSYISDTTVLGYSSIFRGVDYLEARMKSILSGKFNLNLVPKADELTPNGWTSAKVGTANSTNANGTQITKEAKWADDNKTAADVKLQFSHADKPGMDFLFIVDLSNSMSNIGGSTDQNSRFYDMQSKLIDVSTKLVTNDDYNNQVAFVTFGGHVSNAKPCHHSTIDFTNDPSVVAAFEGMTAKEQNTDYYTAFLEAQKLVTAHQSGNRKDRPLSVVFITDGMPNRHQKNVTTTKQPDGTYLPNNNWDASLQKYIVPIARSFEEKGVNIYGVMQSIPGEEVSWARTAMETICTNGLVFAASDTQSFSDAVNAAIGAAYGTYTITDTVGDDFDLDKNSIKCSENTKYEVSEDGKTITWTIYGLPFTTYTLSFQEKLHADKVDLIGTYTYDTNDGDATVNGDANAVETPQLERAVGAYRIDHEYYTYTGNTAHRDGGSQGTVIITMEALSEDLVTEANYQQTYNNKTYAIPSISSKFVDGIYVITLRYEYVTEYRYRIDHVYYRNNTVNEGSRTGDVREIERVPDIGLVTSNDYQRTYNNRTYGVPTVSISSGPVDGVYVITLRYNRTTTAPNPGPDPTPTPTPTPTPIPDNPTPLNPGPDGTIIPDQDVPLAAPGLNSVDHYAYIIGYPDGLVHPEANVTRAEVATIFFRLMTDEFRTEHWATENAFTDVAVQEWFNNSVSTSSKAGIVKGYEDGAFRPNRNISRAEFAAIAARFLSDEVNISSSFSDISGHWAENEINRAVMAGWIKGYTDGTFRPDQPITRAEAVTMINRMLDRTPDKDHMLEDMIRWPDNTEDKWYYADMQEATNSHDYERLEMVLIEDWTELLENRDWAALQEEWATAASAPGGEVADNLDLSKTGGNGAAQDTEAAEPENA